MKGVRDFAIRYADLARTLEQESGVSERAGELGEISRICRKVSVDPPETFWEALQLLWFLHLWVYLEAPGAGNSLGRFDQYMIAFYESDICGSEDALEFLKCFWIKINELGYGHASQNVTVGGLLGDGVDGTNALTYLSLRATRGVYLRLPHLSVRVHGSTPDELLEQVAETAAQGAGQPQVYNDDVVIPSLVDRGIPRSLAVDYAIQGCIQIYLPGISAPWSDVFLNIGKCLELALNNGRNFWDELKGRDGEKNVWTAGPTAGIETGRPADFKEFEDVYRAFLMQMKHFLSVMAESRTEFDCILPEVEVVPFASTLIGDCLSRGLDAYNGGARYNLSGIYLVGVATVADSLAVIREILEGENPLGVTLEEFVSELKSDFGSNQRLRQWALSIPKYGNDLDDVDALAVRVTGDFCNEVLELSSADGTQIWPILSSFIQNVKYGHVTATTPDGRLAGEPLSNTLCPSFGQDKLGPTAIINSTCKIDFNEAVGGAVLNLRFAPSQLRSKGGRGALKGLLRTYVDLGGRQMQFNCIDNQTLRDAQANPSRHANLLIRVSGFCAKFVNLTKDLQDEIISRMELELG
ncbi:MAG: pyruvate formate lyase family protein, partial [Candidatus Latescibacteria bacterium]|nr:pyruvate formate lyase family protein [Candidatus Latescibacterota bacterium]